jgi:hypothetical protein
MSLSEKNFPPTAIMLIWIKASYLSRMLPLQRIKGRLRAQYRAALACPSSFQCELFAKFGRDGLSAFLNGFGMLGRGNHRSTPTEDRVLANRHIHAANQQLLMDHVLKFTAGFLLLCQGDPFCRRWNSTRSKVPLRKEWCLPPVRRPISCTREERVLAL